jgi:aconitate hydratase
MYSLTSKSANAAHAAKRLAAGMATAATRIGDKKVSMSLLEKGAFINYQRIEDNLEIVRSRCVALFLCCSYH